MQRIHRNIIIFVLLFYPGFAISATLYVDHSCSDGLTTYNPTIQSCTGGSSTVYNSFAMANSLASSGDTISLANDPYYLPEIVLDPGVSLTSTSQNKNNVSIIVSHSSTSASYITMVSATPGSSGNQSISHLYIDGANGGNVFTHGIRIINRSNVSVHDCTIRDFAGDNNFYGSNGTAGSYGVWVSSSQVPTNSQWWTFWPVDSQAPGNNTNINANWPPNPVENIHIYNNHMLNVGGADNDSESASIIFFHAKNSSIHDNIIDARPTSGQIIKSTPAFWDNVDVYRNEMIMIDEPSNARYFYDSSYAIEVWIHKNGTEVYDNFIRNGGISFTVGKESSCRKNYVVFDTPSGPPGAGYNTGVEFHGQSYGEVKYNKLSGVGAGIVLANDGFDSHSYITRYAYAYGNIIHNAAKPAVRIVSFTRKATAPVASHMYFVNNVVDNGHNPTRSVYLYEDGPSSLSNVYIQNNIITNSTGWGLEAEGTISGLVVDHNLFYNNTLGNWRWVTPTNSVTSDPLYTNLANDIFTLQAGSPGRAGGVNAGERYQQILSPTTDWTGGSNDIGGDIPNVVLSQNSPDLGAYGYGSGPSNYPPVVTANDPTQGEALPANTTDYNVIVNATDSDGTVTGCKANTTPGVSYASKTITLADNGDGTWDHMATGLGANEQHNFYYECVDDDTAYSDEFHLQFAILNSATDVIIDNTQATYDSAWTSSTYDQTCGGGSSPCYYGANYTTDGTQEADTSSRYAHFPVTLSVTGEYNVYERHPSDSTRPTVAPHIVTHAGGSTTVYVDQTVNENQWNLIGTFSFNSGSAGSVRITAEAIGNTCADAIMWELATGGSGGSVGGSGSAIGKSGGGSAIGKGN